MVIIHYMNYRNVMKLFTQFLFMNEKKILKKALVFLNALEILRCNIVYYFTIDKEKYFNSLPVNSQTVK